VKCTIGILNIHFLVLKYLARLQDMEVVEDVVHTCVMLHNNKMEYDGRDGWDLTGGDGGGTVDYEATDDAD
jgi:hypothetical protein